MNWFRRSRADSPLVVVQLQMDDPTDRHFEVSEWVTDDGTYVWYRRNPGFTNRNHHGNLKPFGIALQLGLKLLDPVDQIIMAHGEIIVGIGGLIVDQEAFDQQLVRTIGRASGKRYVMSFAK
jgi:hypothetical protein